MPLAGGHQAIIVRPASPADLPAVEAVARETWAAAYAHAIPGPDIEQFLCANYNQEALRRTLAYLERGFLVALDSDHVVGFASSGRNREGEWELFTIYVLPHYHGSGIGSALWLEVERHARDAAVSTFHLWVLGSNEQAIAFYESKGGKASGSRSYPVGGAMIEEVRYEFALADHP